MFSYFRCTNGLYVICGIFCSRSTLRGFQHHNEPPYVCRSTNNFSNVFILLCVVPKLFIVYHISIFKYSVALREIWFMYHNYVIKIIGCKIFQHYSGSFSSSSNCFTYFFKRIWPSINGLTCCSYLFEMLGNDHFLHVSLISN